MTTLNGSLLLQAAADAAGDQVYPTGALYVVATPIGNRADLTLRAIHVLAIVDAIACEDTRHSQPLLRQLGIDKPLIALHRHNERSASEAVLQRLAAGERIACVSDAGTPGLSDPGAVLVAATQAAGFRTLPIPGPSSALAAISVAGDDGGPAFLFRGFLPARGSERDQALAALVADPATQVLFEAPHRVVDLAHGLSARCGERRVTLCRELTKQFESVVTMSCAELPAWFGADPNRLRGEFVLVVHAGPAAQAPGPSSRDALLVPLLEALPLKQAVALAARLSGGSKNALYERALALKAGSTAAED